MTNNTTNQHLSSVDDFIRSNTDKIGISSPYRRPASKKIRESIVTSSGPKDLNFTGTPLKRKNPHRAARAGGTEDVGMKLPPAISGQENLAASEKPPEISAADKLEKRKVERREEKKALADRKARKEIRRLEKEEAKKRKELAALEEAAAEARQSEEAAEAIRLEREKKDAKEAKEARRIARVELKAAEAAEKKATMAAIAKEKKQKAEEEAAQTDSSPKEDANESESDTETEDEEEQDGNSDTEDEMETEANIAEEDAADDEDGMERTYRDATTSGNDDDTVGVDNNRWKSRRVRITIKIDVPKDKETRLINLQEKVNTILELGRRTEPHLFLRKFDETGSPYAEDKGSWIYKFSSTDLSANHICDHLAHGLSNWIPLDRQSFLFSSYPGCP